MTPEETASFQRYGYLQLNRPLFSSAAFDRLNALFEDLVATYGHDDLDVIHFRDDRLLEFLLADEVLDLVQPLVGPDIGLWSSHFISKPPRSGTATPWHEDSAYWEGRVSTMAGIVTVWLAIDPAFRENGSMGVLPGSHLWPSSSYERIPPVGQVFDRQIKPGSVDLSTAVFFDLAPNECTLHDSRIIHGSGPNTSNRRRAGYTMRYFPTTTRIFPERNREHRVWLARGHDRAGNRYANR